MAKSRRRKKKQRKHVIRYLVFLIPLFVLISILIHPGSRAWLRKWMFPVEKTIVEKLPHPQLEKYEVFGADVSEYQGIITWDKLAKTKHTDFVMIRATAGDDHRDKYFTYNWQEAKNNQIPRGAYHYYRPNENSFRQAKNYIKNVELESGDLPPILDIEAHSRVQSLSSLKTGLLRWLKQVRAHYDVVPIIYTNDKFYGLHLKHDSRFNGYTFWLARYSHTIRYRAPDTDWTFWQYTQFGRLKGVKGDVDLNVYKFSKQELHHACLP